MDGLRALVRHLRSAPGPHDAERLATEFGLELHEVVAAIAHAYEAGGTERKRDWESSVKSALSAQFRLVSAWSVRHPVAYFFVSAALVNCALVVWMVKTVAHASLALQALQALVAFLLVPTVHTPVAFRTGRWQSGFSSAMAILASWFVLYAGLNVVLAIMYKSPSLLVAMWSDPVEPFVIGSWMCTGLLGLVAGTTAGFLGGYERARRGSTTKDTLPRGELVRRLLDARERLRQAQGFSLPAAPETPVRRRVFLLVLALVIATTGHSLLGPLVSSAYPTSFREISPNAYTAIASGIAIVVLDASALISLGFFGGSLRWSLALGAIYFLGWNVVAFLPTTATIAPREWQITAYAGPVVLAANLVTAALGATARKWRDWSRREALLRQNDVAAITKEVIDLEWRLAPKHQTECLMAVDVVGSTALKQHVDPMVAEDCFRSYQEMLASIAEAHAGKVHATAGDGAILGFVRADDAFAAAQAILAALPAFNRDVNKLANSFQVRIGIHQDEVYGELSQVQFTTAIDVAAHIEHFARPDGIAVSGSFVLAMPNQQFVSLNQSVDGHDLYEPVTVRAEESGHGPVR